MATAPSSLIPPFLPTPIPKKTPKPKTTFAGKSLRSFTGNTPGWGNSAQIPTRLPRSPFSTEILNKMRILGITPIFLWPESCFQREKWDFFFPWKLRKSKKFCVFFPSHPLMSCQVSVPWMNLFSLDSNWKFPPHTKKTKTVLGKMFQEEQDIEKMGKGRWRRMRSKVWFGIPSWHS